MYGVKYGDLARCFEGNEDRFVLARLARIEAATGGDGIFYKSLAPPLYAPPYIASRNFILLYARLKEPPVIKEISV